MPFRPHVHEEGWSREQALAWLETPRRLRSGENRRLWSMVGLGANERVADIGAGTGYFAFEAARVVGPRGKVWAIDVSPELVRLVQERREERGLRQVRAVRSHVDRIPLPTACADVVLVANLLHGAPERTVAEGARLLRPSGRFVAVDWDKRETEHGPPLARRISPVEAARRLRAVGLEVVAQGRLGADHYVLVAIHSPLLPKTGRPPRAPSSGKGRRSVRSWNDARSSVRRTARSLRLRGSPLVGRH